MAHVKRNHGGLFSNNTAAVPCTQRGAAKTYASEGRLLRVLSLRQQVERSSTLVDVHVVEELNVLGIIPYR